MADEPHLAMRNASRVSCARNFRQYTHGRRVSGLTEFVPKATSDSNVEDIVRLCRASAAHNWDVPVCKDVSHYKNA